MRKILILAALSLWISQGNAMENLKNEEKENNNRRMGLEIETRKIKVHNPTSQNLVFFKVGNPPYWEFTSDTLDKRFDKTAELEKNIANVEARTILGQKQDKALEAADNILLKFFPAFLNFDKLEGLSEKTTKEEIENLNKIHHKTLESFVSKTLPDQIISEVKQGVFFKGQTGASYLPQITFQVSLADVVKLFNFCKEHLVINSFLKSLGKNELYFEEIEYPESRGFLTLFYFYNYRLFNKAETGQDPRGVKKDISSEPGVKSYLSLMSRADLKVVFNKLDKQVKDEVIKKLNTINSKGGFKDFHIKYYLDSKDINIHDNTTLESFYDYITKEEI